MSYYRDVYLQSEDWKNLRAAVIALKAPDGKCFCCHEEKPLDVHHTQYRNLYDVKVEDLYPICRDCHDLIHDEIEGHPEWKDAIVKAQWDQAAMSVRKSKTHERSEVKRKTKKESRIRAQPYQSIALREAFSVLRYEERGLNRQQILDENDVARLREVRAELQNLCAVAKNSC